MKLNDKIQNTVRIKNSPVSPGDCLIMLYSKYIEGRLTFPKKTHYYKLISTNTLVIRTILSVVYLLKKNF